MYIEMVQQTIPRLTNAIMKDSEKNGINFLFKNKINQIKKIKDK